jgi:hypothetical protein
VSPWRPSAVSTWRPTKYAPGPSRGRGVQLDRGALGVVEGAVQVQIPGVARQRRARLGGGQGQRRGPFFDLIGAADVHGGVLGGPVDGLGQEPLPVAGELRGVARVEAQPRHAPRLVLAGGQQELAVVVAGHALGARQELRVAGAVAPDREPLHPRQDRVVGEVALAQLARREDPVAGPRRAGRVALSPPAPLDVIVGGDLPEDQLDHRAALVHVGRQRVPERVGVGVRDEAVGPDHDHVVAAQVREARVIRHLRAQGEVPGPVGPRLQARQRRGPLRLGQEQDLHVLAPGGRAPQQQRQPQEERRAPSALVSYHLVLIDVFCFCLPGPCGYHRRDAAPWPAPAPGAPARAPRGRARQGRRGSPRRGRRRCRRRGPAGWCRC